MAHGQFRAWLINDSIELVYITKESSLIAWTMDLSGVNKQAKLEQEQAFSVSFSAQVVVGSFCL